MTDKDKHNNWGPNLIAITWRVIITTEPMRQKHHIRKAAVTRSYKDTRDSHIWLRTVCAGIGGTYAWAYLLPISLQLSAYLLCVWSRSCSFPWYVGVWLKVLKMRRLTVCSSFFAIISFGYLLWKTILPWRSIEPSHIRVLCIIYHYWLFTAMACCEFGVSTHDNMSQDIVNRKRSYIHIWFFVLSVSCLIMI